MKALLYCCKIKPYLINRPDKKVAYKLMSCPNQFKKEFPVIYNALKDGCLLNGKIVAECDFEVSEIEFKYAFYLNGPLYITKRKEPFRYFSYRDLLKASCLQDNEILKYLGNKNGYVIHIKNLCIFDKPKDITTLDKDYNIDEDDISMRTMLMKAPQNMMWVVDGEEKKVLISIRPEWLVKILNGEKTIEVRKKVLKEMI